MRWKQFFTPVKSITADTARQMVEQADTRPVTVLDVRQPGEYAAGHLPGARLIPLPELTDRLDEIDPAKPVMVY